MIFLSAFGMYCPCTGLKKVILQRKSLVLNQEKIEVEEDVDQSESGQTN